MTKQEARYHIFVNGEERRMTADADSAESWADAFRAAQSHRNDDVQVVKTIPHQVILVDSIPSCNFCEKPGEYDFKTQMGPWANGCEEHWHQYRATAKLGTGMGQKWVLRPKKHTGGVHQ